MATILSISKKAVRLLLTNIISTTIHFTIRDITPLIHSEATYKKPLRYRDVALVEVHFKKTDAAKIIFHYTVKNEATGELICTGSTTQVFVTNGTMELSLIVPDFINAWMKEMGLK